MEIDQSVNAFNKDVDPDDLVALSNHGIFFQDEEKARALVAKVNLSNPI